MAYARTSVIDKILRSSGQGIVFNVDASDVCDHYEIRYIILIVDISQSNCISDDVLAAGYSAKNSIKDRFKKMVVGLAGPSSSTDERRPLLSQEANNTDHHTEPPKRRVTVNARSSCMNNTWRFIVSLFYFVCPCIDDERVILPVNEYPTDLNERFVEEIEELFQSLNAEWFQKLDDAKQSKEMAIRQLQHSKEERVEQEYNRLMAGNKDLTSTAVNRLQAFINVRDNIRLEKEKLNEEFDNETDWLCYRHYHVIVEEEIEMLISFWKKMRLTPS